MKKILFFILMILQSTPSLATIFNNVSLSDMELISEIDRSFATGINTEFGGFKNYTISDLILIYSETKDPHLYNYIRGDLRIETDAKKKHYITITPVTTSSFEVYNYSGNVPNKEQYCIENMEGRCLNKGLNSYLNAAGNVQFLNKIPLFYESEFKVSDEGGKFSFKKLYSKYKLGLLELEVGKDTLWLGHGIHSSILLSSNADPFWLVKFTTDSFKLPFFLKHLGEYKYMLFHGWLDNFNILGQRFGWKPSHILEFGATQTVIYLHEKNYKIWDIPRIFSASDENQPGRWDNDQRASIDVALYMPFLKKIPPLKGGKLYAEYGGEDLFAYWQEEDKKWVGPFGFEFLANAYMLGGMITTGDTDIRIEYSENYRSVPIFYNWYDTVNANQFLQSNVWYTRYGGFFNNGVLMGHHMGREADDFYIETSHRFNKYRIKGFYDFERHQFFVYEGQHTVSQATTEFRKQFGLDVMYILNKLEITITGVYNRYKNADTDPDPLEFNIVKGMKAEEFITGIMIKFLW